MCRQALAFIPIPHTGAPQTSFEGRAAIVPYTTYILVSVACRDRFSAFAATMRCSGFTSCFYEGLR
jgi:hypothetical protein